MFCVHFHGCDLGIYMLDGMYAEMGLATYTDNGISIKHERRQTCGSRDQNRQAVRVKIGAQPVKIL